MGGARLGQNFLVDPRVADRIVDQFLPVEGPILEIGPGRGIITDRLLNRSGRKISAVELDAGLCAALKSRFGGTVEMICGDILEVRPESLFQGRQIDVIGNLPYYLSKELIDWLIENGRTVRGGLIMLQREFVQKLGVSGDGPAAGAQAVMFQHLFEARKCFSVKPGSFSPPPRVTSTVLAFQGKACDREVDDAFYRFLKSCYQGRRKTLWNNLSRFYPQSRMREAFDSAEVSSACRAEEILPRFFLPLYRLLKNR